MLSLAVSIALQAPCGRPPAASEEALAKEIREENMVRMVRDLVALGPRMGGTRSGGRAAERIAGLFREAGLSVEILEDPVAPAHEESRWTVEVLGDGSPRRIEGAIPYGFSRGGEGTGRLSLAAKGESPTVLLLGGWPPGGLTSPGAIGALVDGDGVAGTDYVVLRHQPRRNPGVPLFGIPRNEGKRLREGIAAGKDLRVRFSLEATSREAAPRTVVAALPGRDRSRALLFCAHGDADSGGPGADDNASGVAVVLEIGRALAAARARGEIPEPPCDLRFAVWGSEIHSSGAYVRREREAGRWRALAAVLNFDQAGYGTGDDALFVEPDDVPRNESLVRALLGAAADHRGKPGFPSRFTSNRALGGTDSYVFQQTPRTGPDFPPAVTVFASAFGSPKEVPPTPGFPRAGEWGRRIRVDYDRFYHSTGDLPENTTDREPFNMGWCARVAAIGALRFAESLR